MRRRVSVSENMSDRVDRQVTKWLGYVSHELNVEGVRDRGMPRCLVEQGVK